MTYRWIKTNTFHYADFNDLGALFYLFGVFL